jgi:hypothetical protein
MQNLDAQIEKEISGHEARNSALRHKFVEKKVDLAQPRPIECHFWAWTPEDAVRMAEELANRGFVILTRRAAPTSRDPTLWNIEAGITQSINLTLRREFTDELVRLAATYCSRYDGWGTQI